MAFRKYKPSGDVSSLSLIPLNFSRKGQDRAHSLEPEITADLPIEADVDIDLREVYFLIMQFLSDGPCQRTCGQFWNELLEHQLLPRRYHAWYSRSGAPSGDENDNGLSLPLNYTSLVSRYPHIGKDHLVKLLKQLILSCSSPLNGIVGGSPPSAADVPTLLGFGSFSLLRSDKDKEDRKTNQLPGYLRWPHMQADQVRGLSLREIGGGFAKHHRGPSVRAACYAIAKPSTLVQKMEIIKKLRGHQNAVYCATFDRSGRYVITGSDDRLVKIWSMETAFCLASCRGHEGDITDLAVSSNNALVASSSNDFIIRVWRLPDGLPISILRGHTGAVTAIAFSPRPSSVYQLLSSSDDGTCRIWDARYSHSTPRVYIPKPPDVETGNSNYPSQNAVQPAHQILCCAFNANGTVFVTGSSDTYARVWYACKTNTEESDQPNHEMDVLSGHENDVNYVQFSGCAVASRICTTDISKEDNLPKFKNSWFTHDNIVTCSRDGSAIIWIPKSRRSHAKVGRWTRAYHLKVPPPPMAPQPPRGGPRQRFQPTPRGVNMIVWSLDNRFVLAAIMDCRICVWNASDGSLVHSLIGHSESTFVLDVHPFNPRIAMSAGYDGKTIIWDIWEGTPVRIYETGRFKLVDGKFSPDGTSVVLSDEVGQMFILATGQGESQKDAKYDQFFLGDYRPLMQDTNGNVLDQETQLAPYRRNIQDLLCDSSIIPYPEPYQSMYQKRRLGALGIEWRPSLVKFAVGPSDNINGGDYPMLPIVDLDRWFDPIPEFLDWELENDVQSDDTDSEYNVTEEYSSEGEHGSISSRSFGDPDCSAEDSEVECSTMDGLRRSRRNKHNKAEVEFMTSSGRRVKRRNLDEPDTTISKNHKARKSRKVRFASRKKTCKSKCLRPQRRAARNARNMFSQFTGTSANGEDEDYFESDSPDSESILPYSNTQSNESDNSLQIIPKEHTREKASESVEYEDSARPPQLTESLVTANKKRRLVLRFPVRDSKKVGVSENTRSEFNVPDDVTALSAKATSEGTHQNKTYSISLEPTQPSGDTVDHMISQNGGVKIREGEQTDRLVLSSGYKNGPIKWGEVKARSSKRLRLGDALTTEAWTAPSTSLDCGDFVANTVNGHLKFEEECGASSSHSGNLTYVDDPYRKGYKEQFKDVSEELCSAKNIDLNAEYSCKPLVPVQHSPYVYQQEIFAQVTCNGNRNETEIYVDKEHQNPPGTIVRGVTDQPVGGADMVVGNNAASYFSNKRRSDDCQQVVNDIEPTYRKLRITQKKIVNETSSLSSKLKDAVVETWSNSECELSNSPTKSKRNPTSIAPDEDECTSGESPQEDDWIDGPREAQKDEEHRLSISQDSKNSNPETCSKMYNSVYRRAKLRTDRKLDNHCMEESTSNSNDHDEIHKMDSSDAMGDSIRRTRSMGTRATADEPNSTIKSLRVRGTYGSGETSKNGLRFSENGREELLYDDLKSTSKLTVGLRSVRNRRENYNSCDLRSLDKRKSNLPSKKLSWLMLSEHEEGYRFIPQNGDEVAYLRQGHEEYLKATRSQDGGPWRLIKGSLKAVEFCKVINLEYATLPGSGDSCCKLTLEFIDPSSCAFSKCFKLTLPELVAFPDFLVERTRYDVAIGRNWTHRDKCQVWWRNEDGEGGSWWDGRILAVKPKSPEYSESPWERYIVQYRNDSSGQHLHSPWELHEADIEWEHPRIDDRSRKKLLSSFTKLEQASDRNRDNHGIQKLNQVAQKSEFLNRFPVPLSPEVIKCRLENNYYRSWEAVKHDLLVMLSNAQNYFARNAEFGAKMRRLSDWIDRNLSPS